MDSKTLKSSLKTAVEHIKAERFTETVKICKTILDSHPNNSRALIFLGKAAEGLNNSAIALESYTKAVEHADAGDLLPWQGLCTFYEKHPPADRSKLSQVYEKLISLQANNAQKKGEILFKYCIHLLSQPAFNKEVVEQCEELCSQLVVDSQQSQVNVALANYLLKSSDIDAKMDFRRVCNKIWGVSSFPEDELHLWKMYSSYLFEVEKDINLVAKHITTLIGAYPACPSFCLILAEMYCQIILCGSRLSEELNMAILKPEHLDPPMLEFYNHLTLGPPMSTQIDAGKLRRTVRCAVYIVLTGLFLQGKFCKRASDSLEKAEQLLDMLPACLSMCTSVYKAKLTDLSIDLSFKQQKYADVIKLCSNMECTAADHRRVLILSHIELGNMGDAEMLLKEQREVDRALMGYLCMKKNLYNEAYDLLSAAVVDASKSAEVNLWLGQVCYLLPDRLREAVKYLLTAAKLDPQNEQAFLYLGLYYNKLGDSVKGRKCIKKSYSLNAADDKICIAYVDQLMAEDNNEQALDILMQTTKLSASGSCKWAWFRLGNIRSEEGNYREAVNCFQQALRADNEDSNCWECLADSYVKRGSYMTAIGTFEKACEKNPSSLYSKYQIALTEHKLGMFTESVHHFLEIQTLRPDYTPALKGLGDVHLAIAKEALKQCIYGKAVTNINSALHYLSRAAVGRSDLSCVWSSLGDVLTLTYHLPSDYVLECPVILASSTAATNVAASTAVVDIGRTKALTVGARCYSQCTHLRANNSSAWHDLAVNYLYQSKLLAAQSSEKGRLLSAAAQFCQKAISLDRSVVAHYNCLGVLYLQPDMFDPLAAQHYLIISVELDQNNVQGWTNLAALYLMQGDVNLAHEALNIAQSADPKYAECWTGQAMVAELIGHDEAMDLFRHSTDLGRNSESVIGYAHWVLQTLLGNKEHNSEQFRYSIDRLEAVPVSCYALGSIVDQHPSAQTLNTYGLLLEREGLLKMAVKALTRSVNLSEEDEDEHDCVYRANLARVLCATGDVNGCLEQLQLLSAPTPQDVALTALAYYKSGLYGESFQKYSELLEISEEDETKSHIYSALGMLAVKCDDTETAKTLFFQCYQCSSPSIHGLAALCSLALLTGEGQLAVAALDELLKCSDSENAHRLKCTFSSYMEALKGEVVSARNHLLKTIHCYPLDQPVHYQLLALSLGYLPGSMASILRLCQSVSSVQDLVSVALLSSGHVTSSLRKAQKAAHMYPGQQSNWVLLLSTAHAAAQSISHVTDDITTHVSDDITTDVSDDITTHVTDEITTHVTDDITTHVTDDITTHVTDDITAHVTDDITTHVTEKTIATLLEFNINNQLKLKDALLEWLQVWLSTGEGDS